MPREKFHTLTEQMFYVLLCLKEECYGMDILDEVVEVLYSSKLQKLVDESVTNNPLATASQGENVVGNAMLINYCGLAKVWFFTAILLMFIAYGIYVFYSKNELEYKKKNF